MLEKHVDVSLVRTKLYGLQQVTVHLTQATIDEATGSHPQGGEVQLGQQDRRQHCPKLYRGAVDVGERL